MTQVINDGSPGENGVSTGVGSSPPSPPIPLQPTEASSRRGEPDVRDTAVALALSGYEFEKGRTLLGNLHAMRKIRVVQQAKADVAQTKFAEDRAVEALGYAEMLTAADARRKQSRSELEESARQLAQVIRSKRHVAETNKIQQELDRLDEERRDSIARLANDRVAKHQAAVDSWKAEEARRSSKVAELQRQRDKLVTEKDALRAEAKERMNRWMTRTAAGFLVWAGYTVIGTTGMAVASMMKDHHATSLLSDVASSAVVFMNNNRGRFIPPLILAPSALIFFLASLVGALVGIDLLMRWFDRQWMKKDAAEQGFKFPAKAELSRSTFSKLLMTVPLIYIAGSIVIFVAYGGRTTSNSLLLGESAAVVRSIIGSALSLLSTSMFLLYFASILEPRSQRHGKNQQWRTAWEIGVVPFVMIAAVVLAAVFGPEQRAAWVGITIFMLLGSMALAYGLLYRGLFNDLDYAAHAVRNCEHQIDEILETPKIAKPDKFEAAQVAQVLADYRDRRQQVLDMDRERRLRRILLSSDEFDTWLIATYALRLNSLWNILIRWRRILPQPEFYRTTDLEAAPAECEKRQKVEQEIRQLDLEMAATAPELARTTVAECAAELSRARIERQRAETSESSLIAADDERASDEQLEFEKAFAVAGTMKGSYGIVIGKQQDNIKNAKSRRLKRESPVQEAVHVN